MRTKVLLDSEIGNHIDDAVAMAALCNAPNLQLVGVTTTGEKAEWRAVLARRLLDAYGCCDVPVAAGKPPPAKSMELRGRSLEVAQEGSGCLPFVQRHSAVELMRDVIQANPGLTIIATAPLTNIAALLDEYPEIEASIGRIIFMGGWSTQALPEYNLRADPGAVARVLATAIPLTAVGYEVTLRCTLKRPHIKQLENAADEGPRFLHTLFKAWEHDAKGVAPIMHDPLTVAALGAPHLARFQPVLLKVDLREGPGRGALYRAPDGKQVDVCTAVDTGAYLNWLVDTVAPDRFAQFERKIDPSLWHVQLQEAYHVSHYAGWCNAADTGEHHVVVLVSKGMGTLQVGRRKYELSEGAALYLPAHQPYNLETTGGMQSYWFHFFFHVHTSSTAHEVFYQVPGLQTYYPPHARTPLLREQAERILQYWLNPWLEGHLLCQASLLELLGHLFSISQEKPAASESEDEVVQEAQHFIHANVRRHLTLEEIAQHVGMSKYHLARKFRAAYGLAPLQYHTYLRMQHAKRLLSLNTMPISEVAAQLGYASPHAFSRAFHREVGVPPSEYAG